jgi:hypothetical protein
MHSTIITATGICRSMFACRKVHVAQNWFSVYSNEPVMKAKTQPNRGEL